MTEYLYEVRWTIYREGYMEVGIERFKDIDTALEFIETYTTESDKAELYEYEGKKLDIIG